MHIILRSRLGQFWQMHTPVILTPLSRYRAFLSLEKVSSCPFSVTPSSPTTKSHHWSDFCYHQYVLFILGTHKSKHTGSVLLFLVLSFSEEFRKSSMFCVPLVNPLLLLSSVPLYELTTFCLSLHLLILTWAVSRFWLLWVKLHEHSSTRLVVDLCFHISWRNTRSRISGL